MLSAGMYGDVVLRNTLNIGIVTSSPKYCSIEKVDKKLGDRPRQIPDVMNAHAIVEP